MCATENVQFKFQNKKHSESEARKEGGKDVDETSEEYL